MDSRSKGIGILQKLDGVLCSLQDWFLTNFSLSLSLSQEEQNRIATKNESIHDKYIDTAIYTYNKA